MRLFALTCLLSAAACATPRPAAPSQRLYFAVELRHDGRLVGKPKLLGETGKRLRVERRGPGASQPDYELALAPSESGEDRFALDLDVSLPGAQGHSSLQLLHGEERKLELGKRPGELRVVLMVMKVDSSEFEALMSLAARGRGGESGSI
jgi:hypothetical protein